MAEFRVLKSPPAPASNGFGNTGFEPAKAVQPSQGFRVLKQPPQLQLPREDGIETIIGRSAPAPSQPTTASAQIPAPNGFAETGLARRREDTPAVPVSPQMPPLFDPSRFGLKGPEPDTTSGTSGTSAHLDNGVPGQSLAQSLAVSVPKGAVEMSATALTPFIFYRNRARNQMQFWGETARGAAALSPQDFHTFLQDVVRSDATAAVKSEVIGAARRVREQGADPTTVPDFATKYAEGDPLATAQTAMRDFSEESLPIPEQHQDNLAVQVGQGIGSTVPFVVASLLPGGQATLPALSLSVGQGESIERAIEAGATEEQIAQAGALGSIPGLTDVIPIENMLRIAPVSPGIKNALVHITKEAVQQLAIEGTQEVIQGFLQNAIAKVVHTPEQELSEAIAGEGLVGGLVGLIFGGAKGGVDVARGTRVGTQTGATPDPAQAEQTPQGVDPASRQFTPDEALRRMEAVQEPIPAPVQGPVPAETVQNQPDPVQNQPVPAQPEPRTPTAPTLGRDALDAIVNDERPLEEIKAERQQQVDAAKAQVLERHALPEIGKTVTVSIGGQTQEAVIDDAFSTDGVDGVRLRLPNGRIEEVDLDDPTISFAKGNGTQADPVQAETGADIDAAAAKVETDPSPAQKEAGNYRKGHVTVGGIEIAIENARGSERSGIGADGQPWSVQMPAHYGYAKGTTGADGDQVDIYLGDALESDTVVVVDQIDAETGNFDEHKVLMGFPDEAAAIATYDAAFNDGRGPERRGALTPMTRAQFKDWLAKGEHKKPLAYVKPAPEPAQEIEAQALPENAPSPVDAPVQPPEPAAVSPAPAAVVPGVQPIFDDRRRQQLENIQKMREQYPQGYPFNDDIAAGGASPRLQDWLASAAETDLQRVVDLVGHGLVGNIVERELARRKSLRGGDGPRVFVNHVGRDGKTDAERGGPPVSNESVSASSFVGALQETRYVSNPAAKAGDGNAYRIKKDGDGFVGLRMSKEKGVPNFHIRPDSGGSYSSFEDAVAAVLDAAGVEKPPQIGESNQDALSIEEPGAPDRKESNDGVQERVLSGDDGAGAGDGEATAQERETGKPPAGEVRGSAPDAEGPAEGQADAAQRGTEEPERRGASGADRDGNADRVPDRREPDAAETEQPEPDRVENAPEPEEKAGDKKAADTVKGENYRIDEGALHEARGRMQKARDNVRAIELVQQIEAEGRPATAAEQADLARYVGWGGLKDAFPDADGNFGKGFEAIGKRLKELLTDTEYSTARRSIQYAHYTSETIVRHMWDGVVRMGFKGGKVFEPGMGIGNFAGMMPDSVAASTDYHGLELDHVTARIARLLYPRFGVRQDDFTKAPLPENTYDLVIGNPPFADVAVRSDPKYKSQGFLLHDYFFAKSLDAVRPGGLLAFVTSAGTMNKIDPAAREYLAERADFVGGFRLPGNAFEKNAGTSVTTDILFFRKKDPNTNFGVFDGAVSRKIWTETKTVSLPGPDGKPKKGAVNGYFDANPDMVLGEQGFFDKLYQGRYAVRAPEGFDLKKELSSRLENLPASIMSTWTDTQGRAEIDFGTAERKEGSYYFDKDTLKQVRGGLGVTVERRGKGVKGGVSAAEQERIKALVPVRDALRAVYEADIAGNAENAKAARKRLNRDYDVFVQEFGPINKAEVSYRRPNGIQQESARSQAREEARYQGQIFDEGSFDPSDMIAQGASLAAIARARKDAIEKAGEAYEEGSFDPSDMPDIEIVKRPNIDPFMDDPESYRLRAIERYDDSTGEGKKGRIFYENIISFEREPDINSVGDALLYVLNRHGRLEIDEVAKAIGKSRSETIDELGERIFELPEAPGTWTTREQYLSGNVKKKLRQAQAAANRNSDFERNVQALEAAQPASIPPAEITANMGMPWIPTADIEDFGKALGLQSLNVRYTPALGLWVVDGDESSAAATSTWGTAEIAAPELIRSALNRQDPKVYRTVYVDGKKSRELDATATQAAQEKAAEIKVKFAEWIWEDKDRAQRLADLYNEEYNNYVVQEYDGSYLTTPGISSDWSWRPHQKRVIARIIQDGNTYMAHSVGAGKTSAMIGAGMEMRRLGLVRKPMYVVPNHMLGQFTKEFYEQYPTARIAVADERRFHTDRRKQFIADVANDDLDAVIITHSAFGMIPVSDAFQEGLIQEEIDEYRSLLEEAKAEGDEGLRITRARIEKQIERLEQRIEGRKGRKDQVFTFEEMGTDFLFVDEAHMFRKLDFATKMSNVKGISPEGSQASWDLFVKTRYLESVNPGRNLVLASGTPVTNTMAELYTVSRYLQQDILRERGLSNFDAWAGAFGDTVTNLEQDPSGGYKSVTRFAKFVNVPELSSMVRQDMDVVTSNQLAQYVTRPELKGGKRQMNLAERSDDLTDFQAELAARMKVIADRKGPPNPGDDIILNVINDGRHAAIDMRLVEPSAPNDPGTKLNLMVDNVYRIWKETKRQPFHTPGPDGYSSKPVDKGPAAQMIFANLGLNPNREFNVPGYVVSELTRRGVPRKQIALIADHKTHVAKQRLFNDMNEGKVRILIGSTAKMATGVNAQRRLYAVHNLDPLWFPADDEQRNGRIIRQGNMNPEIEIHDYSTKGTYDSTMWGLMETKARFIQGFFEGDPSLRDMEDLGEASQYEQAKALSTADERLIELTDLRQKLEKARRRRAGFDRELYSVIEKVRESERRLEFLSKKRLPAVKADIAQRTDTKGDAFAGTVEGKAYDERVEFGDTLLGAIDNLAAKGPTQNPVRVGEIGGFPLMAEITMGEKGQAQAVLLIERNGNHETQVTISGSARGLVTALEHKLRNFEEELAKIEGNIERARNVIAEFTPQMDKTFEGQAEIDELADKVKALEDELRAESEEAKPVAQEVDETAEPDAFPALSRKDPPREKGFPRGAQILSSVESVDALKAHKDYRAAKDGDREAAAKVVGDLAKDENIAAAEKKFGKDVTYIAVVAEEAGGRNKLPEMTAELYAAATGARTATEIVQANRAYHTGAKPLERLMSRPVFTGPVEVGKRYVLVDDVSVMGGTLAELANHIQAGGGEVAGVVTLVNASRNRILKANPNHIRLIKERFGETVRTELGIDPAALTADEAQYLANFRDADALRDSIAKARGARNERLRQKGVRLKSGGVQSEPGRVGPETSNQDEGQGGDQPRLFRVEPTTKAEEQADALRAAVVAEIKRLAPHVKNLEIRDGVFYPDGKTPVPAMYSAADDFIRVSLSGEDPVFFARHEVIHHLRNTGAITDRDWRILERAARRDWRKVYGTDEAYGPFYGDRGYSPSQVERLLDEEAVADAFADWDKGAIKVPPGARRIFQKIKEFWERLGNAVRGLGFKTAEDVFARIESGAVGRNAGAMSGIVGSMPALAYHGSPHVFDKFSTENIGTGEGAQAYGWGLYFAGKKQVAEFYRKNLTAGAANFVDGEGKPVRPDLDSPEDLALQSLIKFDEFSWDAPEMGTYEDARKSLLALVDTGHDDRQKYRKALEALDAFESSGVHIAKGRLYEVEIPDDGEYLLWDKPLSEQPEKVREALEPLIQKDAETWAETFGGDVQSRRRDDMSGMDWYLEMAADLGSEREASAQLAAIGIPGIKYLDGSSRNRPLRQIKRSFLEELPEDAEFEDVTDMIESEDNPFTPDQVEFLKRLEADDWFGFDYPAQAISAALSDRIQNWEPSPELLQSIEALRGDATFNYVIFEDRNVEIKRFLGEDADPDALFALDRKWIQKVTKEMPERRRLTAEAMEDGRIEVQERQEAGDLGVIKRWLYTPSRAFARWPGLKGLTAKGIRAEMEQSAFIRRLRDEYDAIRGDLTQAEFDELSDLLFVGDAEQIEFTDADLKEQAPKVADAYKKTRALFEKIGRFVDQHRRAMEPQYRKRKVTLARKMAKMAGTDEAAFRSKLAQRARLKRDARDGVGDPEALADELRKLDEDLRKSVDEDSAAAFEEAFQEHERVDAALQSTSIRKRTGYVPHKFFGSWAVYKKVMETDEETGGEVEKLHLVAGEHGFHQDRKSAVDAAGAHMQADPEAKLVVRPVQFTYPDSEVTALTDASYWKFVSRAGEALQLEGSDLHDAIKGVARRKFRRRIAGFAQFRTGVDGYSKDFDRVINSHIGQAVRYVILDRLKYDAINTMERMGISPNRSANQEQQVLQSAVQSWLRDVNGQKQPLEDQIDRMLTKPWAAPLKVALASGAAAGSLSMFGIGANPLIGGLVGSYVGYRVYRALKDGGEFKTRSLTGAFLGDMAHLKLGAIFNVFSPLVNLSQTFIATYPVMGEKYTLKGMTLLQGAVASRLAKKPNRYYKLLQRADIVTENKFTEVGKKQFTREAWLAKASLFLFDKAENFNRSVSFLAGYQRAIDQGKSEAQAFKAGEATMLRTQFHYGNANKPEVLRGTIARVPLQFKNFMLQFIDFMFGLRGAEVPRFLVALTLLAGGLGLPGLDLLDSLLEMLFDFSPILEAKRLALEMQAQGELVGSAALVMLRGLPSLLNEDVSARIGAGEKFLPMELRDLKGAWWTTLESAIALGELNATAADQLRNLSTGIGRPLKSLEAAANGIPLEEAYKDPQRFWDAVWDDRIAYTNPWKGGALEFDERQLDAGDLMQMAVGGTPTTVAQSRDITQIKLKDEEKTRARNAQFTNRIVRAFITYRDDEKARNEEMAEILADAKKAGVRLTKQQVKAAVKKASQPRIERNIRGTRKDLRADMLELGKGAAPGVFEQEDEETDE